MREKITERILKQKLTDNKGNYYWTEFLGNYASKNRN